MELDLTEPFDSEQFQRQDVVLYDRGFHITHLEGDKRDVPLCDYGGAILIRGKYPDDAGTYDCPFCAAIRRGDEEAVEAFAAKHGDKGGTWKNTHVLSELQDQLQQRSRELKS